MFIFGDFSVSLTFDIVAVFIILGMCMMPKYSGEKDDTGTKLFTGMGICIIAGAVLDIIVRSPLITGSSFAAIALSTLVELSEVGFMFLLLLYTDYAFYASRDHLRRHFAAFLAPFAFIALIDIINVFAGILYTTGDDQTVTLTGLYFVIEILEYLYLFIPAVYLIICFVKTGRRKFFHPLSICVPILCAVIMSYFIPFSVLFLGFSTGLAFLILSRIDSWRFTDPQTGFYNRAYLDHVLQMIADKKGTFKGMITADIEGDRIAFARVLKEELPSAGETVALGNGRFVYFADTGDMTELDMAASLVSMGAEEYDEDHPDKILLKDTACSSFIDDEAIQAAIGTLTQSGNIDRQQGENVL